MKPITIFGGTFDPVHLGHLRAAWEASEQLHAEVHMMPAHVPPHRPPARASAKQRVALLRAALQGQQRLLLDTRELHRDGPSYSVDTLRELRSECGDERPLILLLGTDAFAGLASWHEWGELFGLCHIGIMTRPGEHPDLTAELQHVYRQRHAVSLASMMDSAAGRIVDIPVSAIDISASAVRAILAAGREPRYLLPTAILRDETLLTAYR